MIYSMNNHATSPTVLNVQGHPYQQTDGSILIMLCAFWQIFYGTRSTHKTYIQIMMSLCKIENVILQMAIRCAVYYNFETVRQTTNNQLELHEDSPMEYPGFTKSRLQSQFQMHLHVQSQPQKEMHPMLHLLLPMTKFNKASCGLQDETTCQSSISPQYLHVKADTTFNTPTSFCQRPIFKTTGVQLQDKELIPKC